MAHLEMYNIHDGKLEHKTRPVKNTYLHELQLPRLAHSSPPLPPSTPAPLRSISASSRATPAQALKILAHVLYRRQVLAREVIVILEQQPHLSHDRSCGRKRGRREEDPGVVTEELG